MLNSKRGHVNLLKMLNVSISLIIIAHYTLSRDLQSSESYGERTFNPGTCAYQAAKHCECWAATPFAQPLGPLKQRITHTYTLYLVNSY